MIWGTLDSKLGAEGGAGESEKKSITEWKTEGKVSWEGEE